MIPECAVELDRDLPGHEAARYAAFCGWIGAVYVAGLMSRYQDVLRSGDGFGEPSRFLRCEIGIGDNCLASGDGYGSGLRCDPGSGDTWISTAVSVLQGLLLS